MNVANPNVDANELERFGKLAARWWDPTSEARPLHDLNPIRLNWIAKRIDLVGACVADVGCGGGLLSEALARRKAQVTAIDLARPVLEVARLHRPQSGLEIDYQELSAADLVTVKAGYFDAVCCMEMIEHVPDPVALIGDLAALLKPGGRLFLSTLNRTPLAFATAIVGAEYILRLVPRGTHRYEQFLRPSELAKMLRQAGLRLDELAGIGYEPFSHQVWIRRSPTINYLLAAHKPV
ncbi:MAG TPA: bifunctional 2-polyprenyl-6-hydroxyphenol methylase/3-demethylubiquinol 3-O-methyltransferase UbiG [Mizugakiibacter sp.]|nr:bifunctional 2-polyprenyl-6-hydroxyphenol methylase/3-demethylubiquinol 3-O-methyltransferase UbiG [Mizugakiibacter sp.]